MVGKIEGIWMLEFKLIRAILDGLLKPGVPAMEEHFIFSLLMSLLTIMQIGLVINVYPMK